VYALHGADGFGQIIALRVVIAVTLSLVNLRPTCRVDERIGIDCGDNIAFGFYIDFVHNAPYKSALNLIDPFASFELAILTAAFVLNAMFQSQFIMMQVFVM
jgi:hypothetical protein